MKAYKVKIKERIAEMIATRQAITLLFHDKEFKKYDKIIFDFSEVNFISRAAADQLYKEKKQTKLNIELINLSNNVSETLKIVEKTQTGSLMQHNEAPIMSFKSKTALAKFLSAI